MSDGSVRVVHRDAALLVLDKPTGLPTTSPPGGGRALTDVAGRIDPDAPALHASSRLDAEVSGLVTFTRTPAANRALLDARAAQRYHRRYLALAKAAPKEASGEWRWAIGIDPGDKRKRRAVGQRDEGGKEAKTRYETLEVAASVALLALYPVSGRTHQLRVHAAAAGIALLGDVHYGGPRRIVLGDGRVVTARRVMLHCSRLSLPDVAAGKGRLELSSDVPDDYRRVFAALGGSVDLLS